MGKVCQIGVCAAVVMFTLGSLAAEVPWQCPPGKFLSHAHNGCQACDNGTYMDRINQEEGCLNCSVCSGGRVMVSPCNSSVNTVCRCPDDHHENSDHCTPKEGAPLRDTYTRLIAKIEENVEALRQSLNGTAEQDLLEDVLSEVRMVKSSFASATTQANGTSIPGNQLASAISQLPLGAGAVQLIQSALLIVVLLRPIWLGMKYVYGKLKVMKNLYDKFMKKRPQDTASASSYKIFMDHVEHSIERVQQSLNNGTTATHLQGVLGDVRSVKSILDSEVAQTNISSSPEPVSRCSSHTDGTAPPVAQNCAHLLEQIEKSVEKVRQSLNDQVYADLLEVAQTEVRIVKLKVTSAYSEEPYWIKICRSLISRLLRCCGRHRGTVAHAGHILSINELAERLDSAIGDGDTHLCLDFVRICRSWRTQISQCCSRLRRNVDQSNAEEAPHRDVPATPETSTTDEAQITISAVAAEVSASELSLSEVDTAVRFSNSLREHETQSENNDYQSGETDNTKVTKTAEAAGCETSATLATSTTDDAQSAATGGHIATALAASTTDETQIATTGEKIAATHANSTTDEEKISKTKRKATALTMEASMC